MFLAIEANFTLNKLHIWFVSNKLSLNIYFNMSKFPLNLFFSTMGRYS